MVNNPSANQRTSFPCLAASIILISVAMLMFEILQMVTLSLQTIERNAFMVVSLCLLGLGGGGSIVTWLSARRNLEPVRTLRWSALLFGVALVASSLAASWVFSLPALIIIGVVPYVFVGVYLAVLFKAWPERANRSYFFNLVGSGLGCAGLVWILNGTGDAALTIIVISGISLCAAALAGIASSPRRWVLPAALVLLLVALAPYRGGVFGFGPSPRKGMGMIVYDPRIESKVEWSRWGYLGRLDVLDPVKGIEHYRFGGEHAQKVIDQGCAVRYLFASGGNSSRAIDFKGNSSYRESFVKYSLKSMPFILKDEPDVLVIGIGGGVDIFLALQNGARSVVGVEINPLMVEAGRTDLAGYFDDFYHNPLVTIREMDGRTYVANTPKKFDVIMIMGVDTGAALHSNAHILSENYLYTEEAFDDYLRVLKDDGFLYIGRPYLQTRRTFATGISALERGGVEDPEAHIAIMGKGTPGGLPWRHLLVAKKPLSEEQAQVILKRFPTRVGYLPGYHRNEKFYERYIDAVGEGREAGFIADQKVDFSPIRDDRPFFYDFGKDVISSSAGRLLLKILSWVAGLAAVLILAPLCRVRLRGGGVGRRLLGIGGYFAAIGAGFMFVEICLIQKLVLYLGHPAYSVTVTLFTILIFSGLGSMFSGKVGAHRRRTALLIWVPILAAVMFYGVGLGYVLVLVHPDSLWLRIIIVAATLAPGSFFMGMPFPTMIGLLRGRDEIIIPWAWAINAFVSVLASVLTVLFAMQFGFTAVLYLGAACYAVALLFYLGRIKSLAA